MALKIYKPYVLHAIVPRQKRRHEKGRRTREWGEFWLASFLDKVSVGDNEKNGIYVQTCPFYITPRRKTLDL